MNKIKATTKDGKTVLLSCSQGGPFVVMNKRTTPSAVKARALAMGLVLVGKRQS